MHASRVQDASPRLPQNVRCDYGSDVGPEAALDPINHAGLILQIGNGSSR